MLDSDNVDISFWMFFAGLEFYGPVNTVKVMSVSLPNHSDTFPGQA